MEYLYTLRLSSHFVPQFYCYLYFSEFTDQLIHAIFTLESQKNKNLINQILK